MAIQNDDWDIRKSWLYTEVGGNGDFYVNIASEVPSVTDRGKMDIKRFAVRVSTSGSRYPSDVMLAVANLHNVLAKYGLDSNQLNKELEFKSHLGL